MAEPRRYYESSQANHPDDANANVLVARRVRRALRRSIVIGAMLAGVLLAWLVWLDEAHAPGPEPIYHPIYFVPTYGLIALSVALAYLAPLPLAIWLGRRVGFPKWLVRLARLFDPGDERSQATTRDRAVGEASTECALSAVMTSILFATTILVLSRGRMPAEAWIETALGVLLIAPFVFGFAALWYLTIECWRLRRVSND